MRPHKTSILPLALEAILGFTIALLCVLAIMLPTCATDAAQQYPEYAHLQLPALLLGWGILLACAIFCLITWRLTEFVRTRKIFTNFSLTWVRSLTFCALTAALFFAALTVLLPGSPAVIATTAAAIVAIGVAILVEVMRGLLQLAIQQSNELAEVI